MQLKASAPGSMMLLGEYAVLHGKPALVCAIDKRIHVTLTPRSDNQITIQSARFGHVETSLHDIKIAKPYDFVLMAIKQYYGLIKRGFDLEITSEFSDQVGLGSSAAVIVATLAVIIKWLNIKITPIDLIRHGKHVVKQVQGVGSGADIAASVHGGMVVFQSQPLMAEKLTLSYPITALYAGFKTPTVSAIQKVQTQFFKQPALFKTLCNAIGECAIEGIHFTRKSAWERLGDVMNVQQGLMESLGVNMPILRHMVDDLRSEKTILGAKISGSGLGDCVIGLGDFNKDMSFAAGVTRVPVSIGQQGVQCEKI